MNDRDEPESGNDSDGVISQQWIDTAIPGDPEGLREVADGLQQLASDWTSVQEELVAAEEMPPRVAVEYLLSARESVAGQLDQLRRLRRQGTEAVGHDNLRSAMLEFFNKQHDDLTGKLGAIDTEIRRLRAGFNPLFRPPSDS